MTMLLKGYKGLEHHNYDWAHNTSTLLCGHLIWKVQCVFRKNTFLKCACTNPVNNFHGEGLGSYQKIRWQISNHLCLYSKLWQSWLSTWNNRQGLPRCLLLGISGPVISHKYKRKLYQMLAFGALLKWVTDKVPSKIRWQRLIVDDVSLDYWTCRLHSKNDVFWKTWEPFFSYLRLKIWALCNRSLYFFFYWIYLYFIKSIK